MLEIKTFDWRANSNNTNSTLHIEALSKYAIAAAVRYPFFKAAVTSTNSAGSACMLFKKKVRVMYQVFFFLIILFFFFLKK